MNTERHGRKRAGLENRCAGNPATEGSNPSPPLAVAVRARVALVREDRCQLLARVHVELRVDVREVALDGLDGEEQRLRDVAVAAPFRREGRDAALARR